MLMPFLAIQCVISKWGVCSCEKGAANGKKSISRFWNLIQNLNADLKIYLGLFYFVIQEAIGSI